METQDEYHEYLCTERSDNFLILLIPYAMQNKQDIMCEGLVTEEILYGLTEYLIPTLSKHGEGLYCTKIFAKTAIIFERQLRRSLKVAEELQLPLIVCDSNAYEVVPIFEDYNYLNTYLLLFVIFSLQKLFGIYYVASLGIGFSEFSVMNAQIADCTKYDLLTFMAASTKN